MKRRERKARRETETKSAFSAIEWKNGWTDAQTGAWKTGNVKPPFYVSTQCIVIQNIPKRGHRFFPFPTGVSERVSERMSEGTSQLPSSYVLILGQFCTNLVPNEGRVKAK